MKKIFLFFALALLALTFIPLNVFADDNPVRILFWHMSGSGEVDEVWRQAALEFMAEYPGVKIAISVFNREEYFLRLRQAMKAGNPPDVFACDGGGFETVYYADQGLLKDITPEIRATAWGRSFSRAALDVYSRNNRYFGVPLSMGMIGLWYNKAIFKKNGLTPFATWADLLAGVKKLKAAGVVPIALGETDKWPGYFWWKYLALRLGGRRAFDDAALGRISFEAAPFVRAGRLLRDLTALEPFFDKYLEQGYTDQETAMATGRAAMELMGHWSPGVQASLANGAGLGDDLGFMAFPAVGGGAGNAAEAIGGGEGLALGVNAPAEAVEFLKYVTGGKVYGRLVEKMDLVSVVKGGEKSMKDPALTRVVETVAAAKRLQYYFDAVLPPGDGQAMFDAVREIYAGSMTAEQAMASVQKAHEKTVPMNEVMRNTEPRPSEARAGDVVTAPEKARPADSTGQVHINFWHQDTNDGNRKFWQKLADDFMKEHPGVSIKITTLENEAYKSKLAVAMISGITPDVFRSWGGSVFTDYINAGMVRDLTNELAGTAWGQSLSPGALDVFKYRGRNYAIPYTMGMIGLWYNKAIFKKYGLKEFKTWSELIAGVKKLRKAGVTPIALGEGDKWPGMFWWAYLALRLGGRDAFEGAALGGGSFRDKAFVEAGRRLQELVDNGAFPNGFLSADYSSNQTALMGNGQAAMELMGQWAPMAQASSSENGKGLGDDLGFMPFPMVEGGAGDPGDVMGGGDGLALSKNAPPQALEFLKYITRADVYRTVVESPLAPIAVVKGTSQFMSDANLRRVTGLVAKAGYFQLYYDQYLPSVVGMAVMDATQGLYAKTLTPEKAAEMIQQAWEQARK